MLGMFKMSGRRSRFDRNDGEDNGDPEICWVYVANGGTAYLDNVLRFGFEGRGKTPIHVAKISRLLENAWMLEAEFSNLQTIWTCLGDQAAARLPQPLSIEKTGRECKLLLSYVPGRSLVDIRRSLLGGDPAVFKNLAVESAQVLRLIHDRSAKLKEKQADPVSDFRAFASGFAEVFDLTPEESNALDVLLQKKESRSIIATKELLLHGDFWHGNLIRGADQGELVVIDWQFGRWLTDISFDVYLFLMAGALAAVPYGPAEERAKAAVNQLVKWHADLIPAYLEAYGRPEGWSLLPLLEGMLACCVEKAARSEVVFNTRHPDDVMWRTLFGELVWLSRKSGFFS